MQLAKNPTFENQTTDFEKLNQASKVPKFLDAKCIQCGKCSAVCPHGCIRSFVFTKEEALAANLKLDDL